MRDDVPSPVSEFGAAAIREAAGGLSLGRVVISVAKDVKPEAYRIRASGGGYAVTGGDARGAMYGALDFAEQVELTGKVRDKEEQASLAVRALKFNIPLPGTGYLSEEDLANNQWFWSMDLLAQVRGHGGALQRDHLLERPSVRPHGAGSQVSGGG